jgi:hypothetical protein
MRLRRRNSLSFREMDRRSAATWMQVLELLLDDPTPGEVRAIRNITKLIQRRRTPALFHNGGRK